MVSALGFSDMLSLAQTVGIVGAMVLTLYFSKKQIQNLSIDTQTRGLNDLGEKFLKIVEHAAEDKSIQGVLDNEVKYSTGTDPNRLRASPYFAIILSVWPSKILIEFVCKRYTMDRKRHYLSLYCQRTFTINCIL
jgi:hypothetical protein